MDWEAQDDGFLAKIIMSEGSKDVSVGTPVAVVVEEEEHVSCLSRQPSPTAYLHSEHEECLRILIQRGMHDFNKNL